MTSSRPQSPTDSLNKRFSSLNISSNSLPQKTMSVSGSTRGEDRGDDRRGFTKEDIKIEAFDGDRSKLRQFLIKLKLVFKHYPEKYSSNTSKVTYASLHLKGSAFAWFEPYLTDYLEKGSEARETTKEVFINFSIFEDRMKQVFGIIDEERSAARMISQLKQTGSASQYWARFQQLMSRLNWDDNAKHSAYYVGLSDAIKDRMMPGPPTDFQQLVEESIQYDSRLYERRMEKKGHYSGPTYGNRGGFQRDNRQYGDPMDLDLMEHGRPSRPNQPKRSFRGNQGNNKERDRRRRENLCYNCGKSGHRAKECKSTPERLHMMNDETGMIEKKADTIMEDTSQGTTSAQKESSLTGGTQEKTPDAQTGASEKTIQHSWLPWTGCYDDSCPIHHSDKESSGWFPHEKKSKRHAKRDPWWAKDQESLSIMTAHETKEESLREQEEIQETRETLDDDKDSDKENLDPEDGEDSAEEEDDDSEWEDESTGLPETGKASKAVVIRTNRRYIELVTCWWKTVRCEGCKQYDSQHTHAVYDPDTIPKEYVRRLRMRFCTKEDCEMAPAIHIHQGPSRKVIDFKVPQDVMDEIWGETLEMMNDRSLPTSGDETLASINENTVVQQDDGGFTIFRNAIDERGDESFVAEEFECGKRICPEYGEEHVHLFNVDPEWPMIAIPPPVFHRMVEQLATCIDSGCEWRHPHVHLPRRPDTLNMMITNTTLPPAVDERAYKTHLAGRFKCIDESCTEPKGHVHLFNIDPEMSAIPIPAPIYLEMRDNFMGCYSNDCEWREFQHVHFSKNDSRVAA